MKKIKKFFSRFQRWFIKKIIFINVDIYMSLYTRWLKKNGLIFMGKPKYINPDVYFDGTDYSLISIGENVTLSREVMLLTHDYSLTTALATKGKIIERHEGELYTVKPITIGKNCFVGARASLLPGTSLGDNVIVGACSVIKGIVPNNVVIIGNPAKIIGKTSEFAIKNINKKEFFVER